MKTNFKKLAWAAAVLLLMSGWVQPASAAVCKHSMHFINAVDGHDIEIQSIKFQFKGWAWHDIDTEDVVIGPSEEYSTADKQMTADCQNLQWKFRYHYKCVNPEVGDEGWDMTTQYWPEGEDVNVYVTLKRCDGPPAHYAWGARDGVYTGSELSGCASPPLVRLYPDVQLAGAPAGFENKAVTNLSDYTYSHQTTLNDWTGSLKVMSGTWRFFEHANYEGKQMYVAAPHTINNMAIGYSTWANNGSRLRNSLSSMKPVSCDSKPLGTESSPVSLGYVYGYQDNGCLQKKREDFRNGIDIHYWDQCNGHTQQNRAWYWDPVSGYIRNLEKPGYCVVRAAATHFRAGDNIELNRCTDTAAKNKEWDYDPDTHQIRARHDGGGNSGFCIDHSGTHNGAKIHLWSCSPNDGNSNNQWKITWGSSGY